MEIKIKYFEGARKLEQIEKGNWIDVYANEDVFIPYKSSRKIPLGFAMELPKGYEGHILPRSSTYDRWGLVCPNSEGIIDDAYCGDSDQWHMLVRCDKCKDVEVIDDFEIRGTWIYKGDKIGQMRIERAMPKINLIEVESLGNSNRGGFGTTGGR